MINILSILEEPIAFVEGAAVSLIPANLKAEIGAFSSTFVYNLKHDFGSLAHTLTTEIVNDVWTCLKQTAANIAPQVLAGKLSVGAAVKAGLEALKSDAASVMLPALKNTSEATIATWLTPLVTSSLAAAAAANPTSPAQK